jgi:hypothetical protein
MEQERSSTISLSAYLQLLRHNRNFRRLWMAQIVSEIGDWFYTLANLQPAVAVYRPSPVGGAGAGCKYCRKHCSDRLPVW